MNSARSETCGENRIPQVSFLKKTAAGLLLATLLSAVLLSGCQIVQSILPPTATQPSNLPTPVIPPPPAETSATSTPAGPAESRTLTVWLPPQFDPNSDTPAGNLLRARLTSFADENNVTLNIRIKSESGAAGLLETLEITSVAAPSALPALIALPRVDMETAALKGLVYPLTGLSTELVKDDWYHYAAAMSSVQGTAFCLPFAGDALMLLYRPSRLPVPAKDWQGILNTNQPLIIPAGDSQALLTLELYTAAGGALQDDEGRPTLDEIPLASVLQLYQRGAQLSTFPFWMTQFTNDALAWQAYREQRANWIVTWASNYLSELPADTAIVPLPSFTGPVSSGDGWVWCLTDPQADRRAISLQLADYLVDSQFLASWTAAAGYLPTRPTSLAAWPNSSLSASLQQMLVDVQLRPENEIVDNLGPVLQEAVLQVLQRQIDSAAAAKQAVEKIKVPKGP
ncbi:ABC-type sugar transport system, periplasmic component [Longilinea arvoryzae]|uniref:ABC-type sugar transport system, periplasmic component n=1 Tax=Longilinea arvoryzae TaxID=360412 RepID=A0A0S7BG11_9CHLR|nr:extracellular solute-binding protein [Longilinea arvoryzae]GAP13414.1 ABC-type sugar transport system, periplasmic component [Longilinea arvoryzae]